MRRALELLDKYENEEIVSGDADSAETLLEKFISEIDVDSLSPVEALMKLCEIQELVDKNVRPVLKRATG